MEPAADKGGQDWRLAGSSLHILILKWVARGDVFKQTQLCFSGAGQLPGFAKWAKNDRLMFLRKMDSHCKSVRAAKAATQGLHSVCSCMGLLCIGFEVLYMRRLNGINPVSQIEKARQSHLLKITQLRPRTNCSDDCSWAWTEGMSWEERQADEVRWEADWRARRGHEVFVGELQVGALRKSDPTIPKLLY